jgi:hypothetical protein
LQEKQTFSLVKCAGKALSYLSGLYGAKPVAGTLKKKA